ncbi:MAG TPA: hypothetical protein DCE23_01365 [Firmicutes bacterium]|nr:hypothetical protein [Bacillota bacterium]
MAEIPYSLEVVRVFNKYNFRDERMVDWIIDDIKYDLDNGINTDKYYVDEHDILWCNINGARDLADRIKCDFKPHKRSLCFLNSINYLTEDKIPLNVDIHLDHSDIDELPIHPETINNFISGECVGMALNGKRLDEIDIVRLSNKDRTTLNGTIETYNKSAQLNNSQRIRIKKAFKYIEDNDPDICGRALYNFDYDMRDLEDYRERRHAMEYPHIFSQLFKESEKMLEKRRKKSRKNNKKNNK